MTLASLGLFLAAQHWGWSLETSRSLAVNALVAGEIGYLFSSRRLHGPARFGLRDNPMVWAMVTTIMLLQLAFTQWAPLQALFGTGSLSLAGWALCLAVAPACCAMVELEKYLLRRVGRSAD